MPPAISVIIPVFNGAKYLRECLDSICRQTLRDLEIICVDDCSTDDSLEILNSYLEKDRRFIIYSFEESRGPGAARNYAIAHASGEYLGFLDCDDTISESFFEILYKKSLQINADIVKGRIALIGNWPIEAHVFYDINNLIRKDKAYFCHSFTSAIYRRLFIIENGVYFQQNIIAFEDNYFVIKCLLFDPCICVEDRSVYYYRYNNKYKDANIIKDEIACINELLNMIGTYGCEKNHYLIVNDFLIRYLVDNIKYVIKYDLCWMMFGCIYTIMDNRYKEEQIEIFFKNGRRIKKCIEDMKNKLNKMRNSIMCIEER